MNEGAADQWFAACPRGLENLLAAELDSLGAERTRETVAGVVRIPPSTPITFVRGDANADGSVDIGDVVAVLSYLFG